LLSPSRPNGVCGQTLPPGRGRVKQAYCFALLSSVDIGAGKLSFSSFSNIVGELNLGEIHTAEGFRDEQLLHL